MKEWSGAVEEAFLIEGWSQAAGAMKPWGQRAMDLGVGLGRWGHEAMGPEGHGERSGGVEEAGTHWSP